MKKGMAFLAALAMALSVAACGTSDDKDTLVIAVGADFEEKWNPFYAENAYDIQVIEQVFTSVQELDANNVLIDKAGHISYAVQPDGHTVIYTVSIKEGLKFSDEKPITIDDVIFWYYVISDPNFTGPQTFPANKIKGLKEYFYDTPDYTAGIAAITQTVKDHYSAGTISDEDLITFLRETNLDGWWKGNPAGDIGDTNKTTWSQYIINEGFEDELKKIDATNADQMFELLIKVEFENYGIYYNPSGYWQNRLEAEYRKANLKDGVDVPTITGIQKVDEYTCTVEYTDINIYGDREINALLVPKHVYGAGFEKGKLEFINAHLTPTVGSGPYKWVSYSSKIATAVANDLYFEGIPKIRTVKWQYITPTDLIAYLAKGTVDIANPSGNKDNVTELRAQNLAFHLFDNAGYGYMALQTANLPIDVRKGLLYAMNREPAVRGYYGDDIAKVIERPMTTVLAEYPKDAAIYYPFDLEKAAACFAKAGYTLDAETGKLVNSRGSALVVNVYLGAEGKGNHPAFAMLTQARNDLGNLGVELQIQDVPFNVLEGAMNDKTADMFVLAWGNSNTCDKTTILHSRGGQNRTGVADDQLDKLLEKIVLTIDLEERSALVSQMLDRTMELAVELPLYQRKNIYAYSSRVNMDTVPVASTFYDYTHVLWKVELNQQ